MKPSSDCISTGSEAICSVSCCIEENCSVEASLSGNLLPITVVDAKKLGSIDLVGIGGGEGETAQVTASITDGRVQILHVTSQQRQQQ